MCAHPSFDVKPVAGVTTAILMYRCRTCGAEFVVPLDANNKPIETCINRPTEPGKQWIQ